ncbi:MAG: Asp-tRNA(Asn)/Glu-tRNA(Gln) amidotransferase GatCAB subunit C [Flavobacteriales bacterium]|nr:MAG: Asp-tRNA(Asn)/Glu-tRNA(Gln) amidotransferase GatCAB subunit C [Flavobacteriales bacterium]
MEINDKLLDKLTDLAKLEFEDQEREEIKKDLSQILDFVGKLNELDTENIEPLIYMADETNVTREDSPKTSITKKDALKNAPEKDSDFFRVPKFVEKK